MIVNRHTAVIVVLLLLPGCEAARSMRDDLARLTSSQPTAQRSQPARNANASANRTRPAPAATATTPSAETPPHEVAAVPEYEPARVASSGQTPSPISLAGKSEKELRAMLGAPTSEEDRPPGKRWRYRD